MGRSKDKTGGTTPTLDEGGIVLGERYRDTVHGFTGVATAHSQFLHGCSRVTLERMNTKGDDVVSMTFDAPQLVRVADEAKVTTERTGGDRPMPPREGLR